MKSSESFNKAINSNSILVQIQRSFALTIKDIKIYYNKGPVVVQGGFFPLMLFFAFTMGRIIEPIYIVSGLIFLMLFLTATSVGPVVLPWETMQRTIEKIVSCPVSLGAILLGSLWSSFLFGMLFALVPLIIGIFIFNLWNSINILLVIICILIGGFTFSSFSLLLSVPPEDSPSATMILSLIVKFPVIFLSPLFQPMSNSLINYLNPVVYFLDLLNISLGGTSIFGNLFLFVDIGVLTILGVICLWVAHFLHSKTIEKRISK